MRVVAAVPWVSKGAGAVRAVDGGRIEGEKLFEGKN
jgi:hypothetical protein